MWMRSVATLAGPFSRPRQNSPAPALLMMIRHCLRSNDIACEVSSMVLPGLPAELILWVNNRDAELLGRYWQIRNEKRLEEITTLPERRWTEFPKTF